MSQNIVTFPVQLDSATSMNFQLWLWLQSKSGTKLFLAKTKFLASRQLGYAGMEVNSEVCLHVTPSIGDSPPPPSSTPHLKHSAGSAGGAEGDMQYLSGFDFKVHPKIPKTFLRPKLILGLT